MATVTFVNNINFMSSSTSYYDVPLTPINMGAVATSWPTVRAAASDLSASVFNAPDYLMSTAYMTGSTFQDLSASVFVPSDYSLPGTVAGFNGIFATMPLRTGSSGGSVVVTNPITYIIRGFYPATGQYEYWQATYVDAPNPTGHAVVSKTVVGVINSSVSS